MNSLRRGPIGPWFHQLLSSARTRTIGTEQKVAVITGASQGIGAALVEAYRDRNYRVVATARSINAWAAAMLAVLSLIEFIWMSETFMRALRGPQNLAHKHMPSS